MKRMPEPVSQELQASCKDDIKMPRLKAKSSQEKKEKKKKRTLCSAETQSGETEASRGATSVGNCVLRPEVGWLQPPLLLLS